MAYIEGQVVHDADAHVMETPDWLVEFADPGHREQLGRVLAPGALRGRELAECRALHADAAYRAKDAEEIMARKNYRATGSFLAEDRPLALDLLGVASQLVFPTLSNVLLENLEHGDDVDFLYGTATAANRSQVEFCSVDPRLLAVGYVPLADLERAPLAAQEALDLGCKALLIPWACPRDHATSHVGLDAVWARAQEAGVPILFHVGAADRVLPASHAVNGLPPVQD